MPADPCPQVSGAFNGCAEVRLPGGGPLTLSFSWQLLIAIFDFACRPQRNPPNRRCSHNSAGGLPSGSNLSEMRHADGVSDFMFLDEYIYKPPMGHPSVGS